MTGGTTGAKLGQAVVMAAIVDTLLCAPLGALAALFCFAFFGISFQAFLTFGGAVNEFQGLLAFWALGFLPALAYSAFMMAWGPDL